MATQVSYAPNILFVILLLLVVALAIRAMVATARRHRDHARLTEGRICRSCGQNHPPFAQFCCRCGEKLSYIPRAGRHEGKSFR